MLFCRAVEVNGQSLNDNRTATTKIMQFDKEKEKRISNQERSRNSYGEGFIWLGMRSIGCGFERRKGLKWRETIQAFFGSDWIEKEGIKGNFDIWNVTVGSVSASKHQSVNFNCSYWAGDYHGTSTRGHKEELIDGIIIYDLLQPSLISWFI